MKKFLGLLLFLFLTIQNSFASDLRFVQVDGVLYSKNTQDRLEQLVEDINKQKDIKFVVFSGNNISKPNKDSLEGFIKCANKLDAPYYVILGNKDINKQKEFGKLEYTQVLQKKVKTHKKILSPNYVFEKNKVVFIVVDGSKEFIPTSNGYYKADVLSWLDEQLALYSKKNVVILQHFPVVAPSKRESHYTHKPEEYLNLISNYKNVKAVIAGHFEVNNEQTYDGVLHISTASAPKYRIIDMMDCNTDNPTFWSIIKE